MCVYGFVYIFFIREGRGRERVIYLFISLLCLLTDISAFIQQLKEGRKKDSADGEQFIQVGR